MSWDVNMGSISWSLNASIRLCQASIFSILLVWVEDSNPISSLLPGPFCSTKRPLRLLGFFWSQPIDLPACTLTPWNNTDYVFSFCCFTGSRKMKRIYLLSLFSFLESTFRVAFQLHFHGMGLTRFFPYCSFSPGWSSLWTFPLMEYSWGMWPVQSIGKLVHLKPILIYHCPQSASGFLEPNCFTLCFTSRVWSLKHQGIFSNEVLGQSFHPAFL